MRVCVQTKGLIDYGSLIYLTLQRAKTAREAISVMTDLLAKHGYASSGESFSIADSKEVWVMDLIGKGDYELGAVWVAIRVPEGYVGAHANQARIRTFPRNDPSNCVFASDVVSFAKAHGLYTGADADFSFSDVYAPLEFSAARGCEMRVWSFFRAVAGAAAMDPYTDYVRGYNLSNRMPLFVRPAKKLSALDLQTLMKVCREVSLSPSYQCVFSDRLFSSAAGPSRRHCV
jgi:dipeptidase